MGDSFEGRVVVVTGAAGGLGPAVVGALEGAWGHLSHAVAAGAGPHGRGRGHPVLRRAAQPVGVDPRRRRIRDGAAYFHDPAGLRGAVAAQRRHGLSGRPRGGAADRRDGQGRTNRERRFARGPGTARPEDRLRGRKGGGSGDDAVDGGRAAARRNPGQRRPAGHHRYARQPGRHARARTFPGGRRRRPSPKPSPGSPRRPTPP